MQSIFYLYNDYVLVYAGCLGGLKHKRYIMTEYPYDPNMFIIWCKAMAVAVGLTIVVVLACLGMSALSERKHKELERIEHVEGPEKTCMQWGERNSRDI